ncbi:hypothetical protein OG596_36010 [Streptomyces sp. NBC_01102]|uniref:hypothetical protein n=1 Tax=Streptomyces sp. NBC_01102 TaxID=2903749 RepID=UPI003869720C|nr:hypothetical protein OG596_36010 [Streptomyces sp. NBC_01102]
MLRRIRIRIRIRIPVTGRPAALAAVLAAVLATVPAPAAADGSDGVALRLGVPADFRVYDADEGAAAVNSDFVVPVAVVPVAVAPGDGPERNVKVTVDTSGLEEVARADPGRLRGGPAGGDHRHLGALHLRGLGG